MINVKEAINSAKIFLAKIEGTTLANLKVEEIDLKGDDYTM